MKLAGMSGERGKIIDRPDKVLEGEGAPVFQAFNAMETTKRRHFEQLEILDNKKKNFNLDPTESDKQLLDCLLKDHDDVVRRFSEASLALKSRNPEAHQQLFAYIGSLSTVSGGQPVTH